MARLYQGRDVLAGDLRKIRPVYREVFELLSGTKGDREQPPLADVPLLAQCDGKFEFRPGAEVVYTLTPGAIERTGLSGAEVPTFVIQADPTATAPLRNLFGVRLLEEVLERYPDPGEPALTGDDLVAFREGLGELSRFLLARLQVDRPGEVERDRQRLSEFVDRVEPVLDLGVQSYLDGKAVETPEQSGYFVGREGKSEHLLAFVEWSDDPLDPAPEHRQSLAMAIADALAVNMVETFLAFIDNDDGGRRRLLALAGGLEHLARVDLGGDASDVFVGTDEPELEPTTVEREERAPISSLAAPSTPSTVPAPRRIPLVSFDKLNFGGTPLTIFGVTGNPAEGGTSTPEGESVRGDHEPGGSAGSGPGTKAAPGVDISELDRLGMRITMAYELYRLKREGREAIAFGPAGERSGSPNAIFDVSTPQAIRRAQEMDPVFRSVMNRLRELGVSELHPGFDILTVRDGEAERLIELKSSAVNARVQTMTWNEWKSAAHSGLRQQFWLYLVGNLRADMPHQQPFVRAIRDPFGTLMSTEVEQEVVRRAVQLRVREFEEAEHLDLA